MASLFFPHGEGLCGGPHGMAASAWGLEPATAPPAPHGASSATSPAPGPGVCFAIEGGCLLLFAGSLHLQAGGLGAVWNQS